MKLPPLHNLVLILIPLPVSYSSVALVSSNCSVCIQIHNYLLPYLICAVEQGQYQPLAIELQVPIIYAGVNGLLDDVPVENITKWEAEFREHLTATQSSLLQEISAGAVTPELEAKIKKVVEDHVASFTS